MKIHGRTIEPEVTVIALPRQGDDLRFVFKLVENFDEFNKLCPQPQPRMITRKGETQSSPDLDDPAYKKQWDEWVDRKSTWLFIQSIRGTEGLEFDTIKDNDPATWSNWVDEMRASGIHDAETAQLMSAMITAQGLDSSKIEEATENFLADRAAAQKQ